MTEPIVSIKQGRIKGKTATNLDGQEFYKFLGVPYAKPPIGSLRFKAPQPAEPWEGIKECTKNGNPCLNFEFTTGKFVGSEDCLYLNVHTKELPKPGVKPKPVMVYFHPGGLTTGSGTEDMCDPEYLLTQDIVFVSMNYRLGILGFLSLEDTSLEVPGNAGLKDQTLALKWVQENIANFNGDPSNVTIFGISAGGGSVQFQLISPTSKGLFHKAIAQSGSVLNAWAWGQRNGILVAEKLGQKVSSEKEALDVLMKAPAETLTKVAGAIPDVVIHMTKRRPFSAVIEKPNPTAFLTEHPEDILSSGRYNQVPLIQGVCSREGLIVEMFRIFKMPEYQPTEDLVPWYMRGSHNEKIRKTLKDLYFKDGMNNDGLYDLSGDIGFNVGTIHSIKLMLRNSSHPIYFYVFAYNSTPNQKFLKIVELDGNSVGICHGLDGCFLFPQKWGIVSPEDLTKEDHEGIRKIVKIWTDFARTGVPHPQWEPVTNADEIKYLRIDKELKVLSNPFKERMDVWFKLMEDVGKMDLTADEKP